MVRLAARPLVAAATLGAVAAAAAAATATAATGDPSRPAGPPRDTQEPIRWHIDPGRTPGEYVNATARGGSLRVQKAEREFANGQPGRTFGSVTFRPRSLDAAVTRVRAAPDARVPAGGSVRVEVRGRLRGEGAARWSEWRVAAPGDPAVLPERSRQVQVRLSLTATRGQPGPPGPFVSGLTLAADTVSVMRETPSGEPRTYVAFATREGLVGKTTANGHVIEPRDHFAALPSGRALAPRNTGDYSVRVCSSATGRCAFAPVWDVGPWNVRDDYWNPPPVREAWADLPQGTPQAQAAYEDGYNDGRDGSGRTVRNPAGIDLADGTFWDGVGLADNGWVEVTYLWTGSYPATARVATAEEPVRLRAAPRTDSAVRGLAGRHAMVPVHCRVRGEPVSGARGRSDLWNKVGPGMYVADALTRADPGTRAPGRCSGG